MKYAAQFLVACLVIVPASARSGGGHAGGGGGHAAVGGGFHGMSGGLRGGYSGFRGGYGGNNFYRRWHDFGIRYAPGYGYGSGYYRYGYGYPYLGLWDWGLGWDYPYYDTGYSAPSYDYGYQPPVVIYQTAPPPPAPVHSEIHEYPDTSEPTATIRPAGEPPIYLIAIKGQDNILAGVTYWVEGDTLQYINLQHVQKHVPISSIDRALTSRLNQERNTDLRLPPT